MLLGTRPPPPCTYSHQFIKKLPLKKSKSIKKFNELRPQSKFCSPDFIDLKKKFEQNNPGVGLVRAKYIA